MLRQAGLSGGVLALLLAAACGAAAAIEPPRIPEPPEPRACIAERMPAWLAPVPAEAASTPDWPAPLRTVIADAVEALPGGREALRVRAAATPVEAGLELRTAVADAVASEAGMRACFDPMMAQARVSVAIDMRMLARCPSTLSPDDAEADADPACVAVRARIAQDRNLTHGAVVLLLAAALEPEPAPPVR